MAALQPEKFLTIKEAAEYVSQRMGLKVTYHAMRTRADAGKLPFFREPGGNKRIIAESALLEAYFRPQIEAKRAVRSAQCKTRRSRGCEEGGSP